MGIPPEMMLSLMLLELMVLRGSGSWEGFLGLSKRLELVVRRIEELDEGGGGRGAGEECCGEVVGEGVPRVPLTMLLAIMLASAAVRGVEGVGDGVERSDVGEGGECGRDCV